MKKMGFSIGDTHVFKLKEEQIPFVQSIYDRMFGGVNSEYTHKYDMLRNLVFELSHYAMKMQPATKLAEPPVNASKRIGTLFTELRKRQFPIDENHQMQTLRSASHFEQQLNVHVYNLNRIV